METKAELALISQNYVLEEEVRKSFANIAKILEHLAPKVKQKIIKLIVDEISVSYWNTEYLIPTYESYRLS